MGNKEKIAQAVEEIETHRTVFEQISKHLPDKSLVGKDNRLVLQLLANKLDEMSKRIVELERGQTKA